MDERFWYRFLIVLGTVAGLVGWALGYYAGQP
jgi:hypothetical protein